MTPDCKLFNPCANGHVFTWSSNTTAVETEPPDGTICECGLMRYRRKPVQIHESVELWTRLAPAETKPEKGQIECDTSTIS